jgi:hypothetical protein
MTSRPFRGLFRLESLELDWAIPPNSLNFPLFENLTSLKFLVLSMNGQTQLTNNLFNDLHNLEELDLYGNELSAALLASKNLFTPLVNLKRLVLQSNGISTLNDDIFRGLTNVESIFLNYNKFNETEVKRLNETLCAFNLKCKLFF